MSVGFCLADKNIIFQLIPSSPIEVTDSVVTGKVMMTFPSVDKIGYEHFFKDRANMITTRLKEAEYEDLRSSEGRREKTIIGLLKNDKIIQGKIMTWNLIMPRSIYVG